MFGNRAVRKAAAAERKSRLDEVKGWVKANKAHRVAAFETLHLFPDRIVRLPSLLSVNNWAGEPDVQPVAGVSASVEASGGVAARATLTRTAVPGAHGWQKQIDTRELWLTVDGPDFQWQLQVQPSLSSLARQFAATVNTLGRQAG